MNKSTKLILSAIILGGIGFFLYKKGLFKDKSVNQLLDESVIDDTIAIEKDKKIEADKKLAVEPVTLPVEVVRPNPILSSYPIPYDAFDPSNYYKPAPEVTPAQTKRDVFLDEIYFENNNFYDYNKTSDNQFNRIDYR